MMALRDQDVDGSRLLGPHTNSTRINLVLVDVYGTGSIDY